MCNTHLNSEPQLMYLYHIISHRTIPRGSRSLFPSGTFTGPRAIDQTNNPRLATKPRFASEIQPIRCSPACKLGVLLQIAAIRRVWPKVFCFVFALGQISRSRGPRSCDVRQWFWRGLNALDWTGLRGLANGFGCWG